LNFEFNFQLLSLNLKKIFYHFLIYQMY